MLGAPRPAGSALATHALSCLQALQSRRRCLPAEPGLSFSVAINVVRGVQTDPKRRIWREPCNRGVPYSHISDTTGRFLPVSMIHVHTHLESWRCVFDFTVCGRLLGASRGRLWSHSPRVSRRAETLYWCGLNHHIIELRLLAGNLKRWTLRDSTVP